MLTRSAKGRDIYGRLCDHICMTMLMSSPQAAARLGVTTRQVERLASSGVLHSSRTASGDLLLDATSVLERKRLSPARGRPLSAPMAWALLWDIQALEVPWLAGHQRARLARYRSTVTAVDDLLAVTRNRGQTRRYEARLSVQAGLEARVVTSGHAAGLADRTGGERATVEGYCVPSTEQELITTYGLVSDPRGTVVLHVTSFAPVLEARTEMPDVVTAADLALSIDPRERSSGHQWLRRALDAR